MKGATTYTIGSPKYKNLKLKRRKKEKKLSVVLEV